MGKELCESRPRCWTRPEAGCTQFLTHECTQLSTYPASQKNSERLIGSLATAAVGSTSHSFSDQLVEKKELSNCQSLLQFQRHEFTKKENFHMKENYRDRRQDVAPEIERN